MQRRKSQSLPKIQRSKSVEEQVIIPLPLGYTQEQEQEAYGKLKERFDQEVGSLPLKMVVNGDQESCLLRFLRARQYNIDETLKMIKNTIEWRKKNDVDDILNIPLSEEVRNNIREQRHSAYCGFDRLHRPIYIEKLGKLNAGKLFASGVSEEDVLKYHIQEMEVMSRYLLKKASKEAGGTVDSIIQIYDVSGVGTKQMTSQVLSLFQKLVGTDSDNYPETNAGVYVINSSTMFQIAYRMVERMMDPRTTSKIKLFGQGTPMKKKVSQLFDPSQIPEFVGGTQNFEDLRKKWGKEMDEINLEEWDNINEKDVAGQKDKEGDGSKQQQQENGSAQKTQEGQQNQDSQQEEGKDQTGNSIPLPPGRINVKPQDGMVESQFKEAAKRSSLQDEQSDGFHTPKTEFSQMSGRTAFFDATKDYGSGRQASSEILDSQNSPQKAAAMQKAASKGEKEGSLNKEAAQNGEGQEGEGLQNTLTLTAETLKSHREMLQTEKPGSQGGPVILDEGSIDGGDKEKKTVTKNNHAEETEKVSQFCSCFPFPKKNKAQESPKVAKS